ncbi:hypothetical protein AAULR_25861, partial [Lacticaseibacillus rhamnosus MTCC 5462]
KSSAAASEAAAKAQARKVQRVLMLIRLLSKLKHRKKKMVQHSISFRQVGPQALQRCSPSQASSYAAASQAADKTIGG